MSRQQLNVSFGKHLIGPDQPPFLIAEMSGNHNQSLEKALKIVDAAAESGAHAIKLQTYTADSITLDVQGGEFEIKDKGSLWNGQNLHKLYQQASTPRDWHPAIFQRAKERGILCFSSPFDESAVDFLEELNAPMYKIASFENVHLPLIRRAARTGKPVIVSTGMANLAELEDAVQTIRKEGNNQIVLLKCTSTYPATPENTNVRTIPHMAQMFDVHVGLSDHTMGVGVAVAAVALGARVIEKHFTLNRAEGGVDSAFSMEPAEFKALATGSYAAWQALGEVRYGPTEAEIKSLQFRRSIYVAKDIKKGETFTTDNLRIVRPGLGLAPKHLEIFLGRTAVRDAPKGTAVSWDLL